MVESKRFLVTDRIAVVGEVLALVMHRQRQEGAYR